MNLGKPGLINLLWISEAALEFPPRPLASKPIRASKQVEDRGGEILGMDQSPHNCHVITLSQSNFQDKKGIEEENKELRGWSSSVCFSAPFQISQICLKSLISCYPQILEKFLIVRWVANNPIQPRDLRAHACLVLWEDLLPVAEVPTRHRPTTFPVPAIPTHVQIQSSPPADRQSYQAPSLTWHYQAPSLTWRYKAPSLTQPTGAL